MIFDNVQLLGYTHENKFFGEKSISYASVKSFSIKGYILDLTNTNGVTNILNDAISITNEAKSFQNIVINGENFGIGKVKSFNVDAGNWVRTTEYSADIEVLSEAPLQNISSSEFNNLNLNSDYIITNKGRLTLARERFGHNGSARDVPLGHMSPF